MTFVDGWRSAPDFAQQSSDLQLTVALPNLPGPAALHSKEGDGEGEGKVDQDVKLQIDIIKNAVNRPAKSLQLTDENKKDNSVLHGKFQSSTNHRLLHRR